jgi:hypothetical protein
MSGPRPLDELEQRSLFASVIPEHEPLLISPWVAMSLLQKAIRRGEREWALKAAATLLRDDPVKLWRRIRCISFEDVGLADQRIVGLSTHNMSGIASRRSLGGEWRAAATIVSHLTTAAKCRAADDLLMSSQLHPDFQRERRLFRGLPDADLMRMAKHGDRIQNKALALWFLAGTNKWSGGGLGVRQGDPQKAFRCLRDLGGTPSTMNLAEDGFSKTRSPLCLFVGLLSLTSPAEVIRKDDPLPPSSLIGGIPSWALDLYSKEGRNALGSFLRSGAKTAAWIRRHVHAPQQISFLGSLVFRVEGQRCLGRWRWPLADELRGQVDFGCHGARSVELLGAAEAELPILNQIRAATYRTDHP